MSYDDWKTTEPAPPIPACDDEPDLDYVKTELIGGTAGRISWTSSRRTHLQGLAESLAEEIAEVEESASDMRRTLSELRRRSGLLLECLRAGER